MTTESKQDTRPGRSLLLGAAGAAFVAGALMAVVAWLFADQTAVRSVAVSTPARRRGDRLRGLRAQHGGLDHAQRHGARRTGDLRVQLVVLAAVVLGLARNGMMDDTFDRRWFGGGVAVATLAWMVAQIVAAPAGTDPGVRPPGGGCAMTLTLLLLSGARWLSSRPLRSIRTNPHTATPGWRFPTSSRVPRSTASSAGVSIDGWARRPRRHRHPARCGAGDLHDFRTVRRARPAPRQADLRQERQ